MTLLKNKSSSPFTHFTPSQPFSLYLLQLLNSCNSVFCLYLPWLLSVSPSFCRTSVMLSLYTLPSLSNFWHVHPKAEKQGHMCGDSRPCCAPDVPAEAVKSLSAGRAHFIPVQDMWTIGSRTTRWLLSGCMSNNETESLMKLLGPCVDLLLLGQWLSELLVLNRMANE